MIDFNDDVDDDDVNDDEYSNNTTNINAIKYIIAPFCNQQPIIESLIDTNYFN